MLSIKVIPAAIDFLKPTDLVQTMALAVRFKPGYKLDSASAIIGTTGFSVTYAEPKPPRVVVQAHPARACLGMPGSQQIGDVAKHETTVPRTHELFCI